MPRFLLLAPEQVSEAILNFSRISETDAGNPVIADRFFETYGPGNFTMRTDKPFERFNDYENLLLALQQADGDKFKIIHKGTPFYFLAWTVFEIGNYEKGVFYMDAAISEDIRKNSQGWLNESASRFLLLKEPTSQPALRIALNLRALVENQIDRFNTVESFPDIAVENFVGGFVEPLVKTDRSKRSIVTAFYSFLMEFEDLRNQLLLRSTEGGSIEPFVMHLLKGV